MNTRILFATGLCVIVATTAWALAERGHSEREKRPIDLAKTPAAVQSALRQAAGDATIAEVERETEDGVTVYEAGWEVQGVEYEATVDETGQVLETEHAVAAKEVPAAVRRAVRKHLPDQAKMHYEKKLVVLYSVEASVDGEEVEILLDPAGRRVEFEVADEQQHEQHGDHDGEDDETDDD